MDAEVVCQFSWHWGRKFEREITGVSPSYTTTRDLTEPADKPINSATQAAGYNGRRKTGKFAMDPSLLWKSYQARYFLKTEAGWIFAVFGQTRQLYSVADDQIDRLLKFHRTKFIVERGLDISLAILFIGFIGLLLFMDNVLPAVWLISLYLSIAVLAIGVAALFAVMAIDAIASARFARDAQATSVRLERDDIAGRFALQYASIWSATKRTVDAVAYGSTAALLGLFVVCVVAAADQDSWERARALASTAGLALVLGAGIMIRYTKHRSLIKRAEGAPD